MAVATPDQAFITKFEKDIHLTYRLMASKLRGLVRTDADVNGSTARFYKRSEEHTLNSSHLGISRMPSSA